MENSEVILLELEEFNRGNCENKEISQNLENFIENVAKTGKYIFPWIKVKNLYIQKIKNVFNNLNLSISQSTTTSSSSLSGDHIQQLKERILDRMDQFKHAPFTIQRISELLLKPSNNYTRQDKYLRGLEKCVMVVTTVDPYGCKIFEDDFLTNGDLSDSESISVKPPSPDLNVANESENNIEMNETEVSENSVSMTIESTSSVTTTTIKTNTNETEIESVTKTIVETVNESIEEKTQDIIQNTSNEVDEETVTN